MNITSEQVYFAVLTHYITIVDFKDAQAYAKKAAVAFDKQFNSTKENK